MNAATTVDAPYGAGCAYGYRDDRGTVRAATMSRWDAGRNAEFNSGTVIVLPLTAAGTIGAFDPADVVDLPTPNRVLYAVADGRAARRRYLSGVRASIAAAYPLPYLPPLPSDLGNGARGFLRLAAVHDHYGLAELGNPYAAGYVGVPDVVGGYALAAVTDDGATLCETCVVDPANPVHPAIPGDRYPDGWGVAAWITSGDLDGPDGCDHCEREWTGHEEGDR